MSVLVLEERDLKSNKNNLRSSGFVPGIIYGGESQIPVQLPLKTLKQQLNLYGRTKIFEVKLGKKTLKVFIKDFQVHPLSDEFIHFDLLEVSQNREIRILVPVELVGKAKGLVDGGILEQLYHHITMVGLIKHIPEKIELEISNLGVGDSLHIRDIPAIKHCRIVEDESTTLVVMASEELEKEASTEEPTETP